MKSHREALLRIALFVVTLFLWTWIAKQPFSSVQNLFIIVGGILLVFPVVWLGRKALDKQPTTSRAVWITTLIHFALMVLFGATIIRAVITHQAWVGWTLPIPGDIGWHLVLLTGAVTLLSVVNLAWKGLGAPFAIALTRKLSVDWMYAWTRNPMVLATLAFLLALGIWFQSALFVLWVLILVTPAWLVFVKIYEERELGIRFGAAYQEYKSRTPMLFPRRPRS
jgi:protein-S-isoprenylcysteine O-methyltransferase Ste14